MMAKVSAGLLMYRFRNNELEVLIGHPGGPFWRNFDEGVWSVPKGQVEEGEDLLECAKREFEEETGIKPEGKFVELGDVKFKSGKIVHAWAFESEWDGFMMKQHIIEIEFPPKSGKKIKIPELDRISFFKPSIAKEKINPIQREFIDRLEKLVRNQNR